MIPRQWTNSRRWVTSNRIGLPSVGAETETACRAAKATRDCSRKPDEGIGLSVLPSYRPILLAQTCPPKRAALRLRTHDLPLEGDEHWFVRLGEARDMTEEWRREQPIPLLDGSHARAASRPPLETGPG